MNGEGAVQRELGELKQKIAGLEKSHGRQLGELRDQFVEFLHEERTEHKAINLSQADMLAEIRELKTTLEVHLATAKSARRTLGAVAGLLGAGVMALARGFWDLWKSG